MLICTRFGIGIRDSAWFQHRLELIAAVTAPSLLAQRDQGFHWLLFVDSSLPANVRERLEAILAPFNGRAALHTDPHFWAPTVHQLGEQRELLDNDGYMLTARIDDDDAWHIDTVGETKARVARWRNQASRAPGYGLTFPIGLEWTMYDMLDVKRFLQSGDRLTLRAAVRAFTFEFHSMSIFVYSRPESEAAAISIPHSQGASFLQDVGFDVDIAQTEHPMWLYCRHKHTASGTKYSLSNETAISIADLERWFGINRHLTEKYLAHASSLGYLLHKDTDTERFEMAKDLAKIQQQIDSNPHSVDIAKLERERASLKTKLSERQLIEDPERSVSSKGN